MGFEKTDLGFVVWRKNQQGVNLDRTWVQRYEGSNFWTITDLPYPRREGGGMVRLFRFPTPIDRENTLVWNYRLLKASGWRRDLWRFLYKNRVHLRGGEVLEQDRVALSQIPVDALQRAGVQLPLKTRAGSGRRQPADRVFASLNRSGRRKSGLSAGQPSNSPTHPNQCLLHEIGAPCAGKLPVE